MVEAVYSNRKLVVSCSLVRNLLTISVFARFLLVGTTPSSHTTTNTLCNLVESDFVSHYHLNKGEKLYLHLSMCNELQNVTNKGITSDLDRKRNYL